MIFFVSDLHLSPRSVGATRIFLDFLAGRARTAEQLFILGDLFEAWIGDDDLADSYHADSYHAEIATAFRQATGAGLLISLLHGNRDFLLGPAFAAATGVRLLPDPYVLSLPTWQFVLSHGDALCTGDKEYMAFRQQVRQAEWQAAFLARPLTERRALAAQMRARSELEKQDKAAYLMDVDAGETDDFLRQHGYATMIHGHTHRPATHDHIVDGIHVERWVLSDWHEDRGECLCWNGTVLQREALT